MAERKKQKREHISEHFVDDLVDDLLVRLPTKSLLRFKCISKAWQAIISSSGFRKKHLIVINSASNSTSNDGHRIILSSGRSVESTNFTACGGGVGVEINATTLEFPFKHPHSQDVASEFEFEVVGSCDGLLCLVMLKDSSIVLWNPCIGEYKILPLAQPRDNQVLFKWCGFGYDPSSDDYKVIRFASRYVGNPVDILSLKTETWKRTQNLPFALGPHKSNRGTLVDGVLYWLGNAWIVGFDLKVEKFERVKLPADSHPLVNEVQLGVFQGRLFLVNAVVSARESGNIELWVLTKNEKKQIWTQLIRISTRRLKMLGCVAGRVWYPIFFARNGQVLMTLQTRHVANQIEFWICSPSMKMLFKGKRICLERNFRWQFTKLNFPGDCLLPHLQVMTYIETLVSPNLL